MAKRINITKTNKKQQDKYKLKAKAGNLQERIEVLESIVEYLLSKDK